MTLAVAAIDDKREGALLKAIGLDKVPAEQRELALSIARRYDLDLMLKHLQLIEGRPFITRDGLLHIAHRSGVFDGMEVSEPKLEGGYWHCTATVYRKDMTRGFTFSGRYPAQGGNQKYAPEMATKTAESHAFRRAFDISAPTVDERWDMDVDTAPVERKPVSLAEKAAAGRARIEARVVDPTAAEPETSETPGTVADPISASTSSSDEPLPTNPAPEMVQCDDFHDGYGRCRREAGHVGNHAAASKETWA